jgi:hypothetical protein
MSKKTTTTKKPKAKAKAKKADTTISFDNFLDPKALAKNFAKKKAEHEMEKNEYFNELSLLCQVMGREETIITSEEFGALYNNICDNLNRLTAK